MSHYEINTTRMIMNITIQPLSPESQYPRDQAKVRPWSLKRG